MARDFFVVRPKFEYQSYTLSISIGSSSSTSCKRKKGVDLKSRSSPAWTKGNPRAVYSRDFKLEWDHTRTIWRLYLQDRGKPVYELDTPVNEPWFKTGMVVECAYDASRDAWIPQFERTDKNFPNNRRTYYRTLVNIKENLQLEDFKELARSML